MKEESGIHSKDLKDENESAYDQLSTNPSPILDRIRTPPPSLPKLTFSLSNIVKMSTEGIVNCANECLMGGGGVDGAIHAAADGELREEIESKFPGPVEVLRCHVGDAVLTQAYGDLKAHSIIHTVGPYLDEQGNTQDALLDQCYGSIIFQAKDAEIGSIAIPSISTGFYGFPMVDAAVVALNAIFKYSEVYNYYPLIIIVDINELNAKIWEIILANIYVHQKRDIMLVYIYPG